MRIGLSIIGGVSIGVLSAVLGYGWFGPHPIIGAILNIFLVVLWTMIVTIFLDSIGVR